MKFTIDHDLHLHSQLSSCSSDPAQTAQALLDYGVRNRLTHICVTDHFWDEHVPGASGWYKPQDFSHISRNLPLPQAEGTTFHFGCETDMDKFCTVGISDKALDKLSFIIIPTSHLHMGGFTIEPSDTSVARRAELYLARNHALLDMDLPFHKIGLAHFTCGLMASGSEGSNVDIIGAITDGDFRELFTRAAKVGIGIELNMGLSETRVEALLRPYRIAKECGCKFYLGSDAHHPKDLEGAMARFTAMIDALGLEESDKFLPFA